MRPIKTELSPRQRQIILSLALGKTRSQVASELSISPSTISNHLQSAFKFLGAVNLVDAVLKLQGDSLLPLGPVRQPAPRARSQPTPLNVNMRLDDDQVLVTLELSVRLPLETLQGRLGGAPR
jgi:DNA-binding CsgD family transcriptional regulator